MPALCLNLEGDGCWPDLTDRLGGSSVVHLGEEAPPIEVAVLCHGMTSGKPSVTIRIDLPDGRTVLAETSARLFVTAGSLIMARFPNLYDD